MDWNRGSSTIYRGVPISRVVPLYTEVSSFQGIRFHCIYTEVSSFQWGWNRGVPLYTKVSSFQGAGGGGGGGIEGLYL